MISLEITKLKYLISEIILSKNKFITDKSKKCNIKQKQISTVK